MTSVFYKLSYSNNMYVYVLCLCWFAKFTSLHILGLDGGEIILMASDDRRVDDRDRSCAEGIRKSRMVLVPRRTIIT